MIARPRNHQERTAVSSGSGGRLLLGVGEDLRQRADQDDRAFTALRARGDVDALDQRANDRDRLGTRRLACQQVPEAPGLSAIELRHVGVKRNNRVQLIDVEISFDPALAQPRQLHLGRLGEGVDERLVAEQDVFYAVQDAVLEFPGLCRCGPYMPEEQPDVIADRMLCFFGGA
jgi:hypothetical protein